MDKKHHKPIVIVSLVIILIVVVILGVMAVRGGKKAPITETPGPGEVQTGSSPQALIDATSAQGHPSIDDPIVRVMNQSTTAPDDSISRSARENYVEATSSR